MKKTVFLLILFLGSACITMAQDADIIKGLWLNEEKDGEVEIYKAAGKYFGKITWTQYPYEDDGRTPRRDKNNPDPKLKEQTIIGSVVLNGFTYDKGMWVGGSAYDPKTGKTYKCRMKMKGNTLEIRGYIGKPILGVTTVWTRKT